MTLLRPALIALAARLAAPPASPDPGVAQPASTVDGLCRGVAPIADGSTVQGSTDGVSDRAHASCARQALSGERVYALYLGEPAHVSVRVAADYDVAVYVRRDCGDEVTEVACNDDLTDARHAGVDLDLAAGTWFVFVDGYDSDSSGRFTLSVSARPSGPPAARRAPWQPGS